MMLAGACSDGVHADTGTDAYMQMPGAQFFRGPMPQGSASGPAVEQLSLVNNNIWPGLSNDPFGGRRSARPRPPRRSACKATSATGSSGRRPGRQHADVPELRPTACSRSVSSRASTRWSCAASTERELRAAREADPDRGAEPAEPPREGRPRGDAHVGHRVEPRLHVVDPTGVDIYWGNQSAEPPPPSDRPTAAATATSTTTRTRTASSTAFAARTPSGRTSHRRASTRCASTRPPSAASRPPTGR